MFICFPKARSVSSYSKVRRTHKQSNKGSLKVALACFPSKNCDHYRVCINCTSISRGSVHMVQCKMRKKQEHFEWLSPSRSSFVFNSSVVSIEITTAFLSCWIWHVSCNSAGHRLIDILWFVFVLMHLIRERMKWWLLSMCIVIPRHGVIPVCTAPRPLTHIYPEPSGGLYGGVYCLYANVIHWGESVRNELAWQEVNITSLEVNKT